MARDLSKEQRQELRDLFDNYDLNKDGLITLKELRLALLATGVDTTEAELYDLLRAIERHQDEPIEISFDDFLRMMAPRLHDIESEENLRHAFEAFNRMGLGYFTALDLHFVMNCFGVVISEEDAQILMTDMSPRGRRNNAVTLQEFLDYMMQWDDNEPGMSNKNFHISHLPYANKRATKMEMKMKMEKNKKNT